ncbi:hypothetical protein [Chitinibacter sp. ZOR0017]|uniref:hypothetical protein n=1 Tax=Chitinibacter sp. ZOR0017 TaxID=1339254 RepID=UPI0012E03C95|nr:hypothetical protein [Chitinibacter sp. ZOR0017]
MKSAIVIVLTIYLSGCALFQNAEKVTGDPQKAITLEEAFRSVGASMRALEEAKGDKMLGIATSEIQVTFNISSKATDTRKLEASAGTTSKATTTNESSASTGTKDTSGNSTESSSSSTSGSSAETGGNKSSSSNIESGKSGSSSASENTGSNTTSTKSTAETGASANLRAEIGSTVEGNRSNVITVKLQSLPALLSGLDKEKIELLKYVGYFKKDQIQTVGNQIFFMLPE